jgi:hypothetical protein
LLPTLLYILLPQDNLTQLLSPLNTLCKAQMKGEKIALHDSGYVGDTLIGHILKSEIEWLSHIQDIAAECHFYDN